MGFSAGVMIAVSIFELLPEAMLHLNLAVVSGAFFAGMISVTLLDFFIPHQYMHEQACEDPNENDAIEKKARLLKTGS